MTGPRRSQRQCTLSQGYHGQLFQPQPQRKRKDEVENLINGGEQSGLKRFKLTAKNLDKLQKREEQKEDKFRVARRGKTPPTASKITTATTTDKLFATRLAENGVIYEPFDTEPPDDAQELRAELLEEHEAPEWVHSKWEKIKIAMRENTQSELSMECMIVESMFEQHDRTSPSAYQRFRHDQWTEVDNEIRIGITDAKPDVTEAFTWSAFPSGARDEFEELIVTQYAYAMPTFAMESKGPSADMKQALRQAAYDGAIMTHAALAVESHIGKPDNRFRNTKAITLTLSASEISVYANHAIEQQTESGKTFYHQYRILRLDYMSSEHEWNRAHDVLYNAQKFARGLAEARITDLKVYLDSKVQKHEQLKLKQAKLQKQAEEKAIADMERYRTGN